MTIRTAEERIQELEAKIAGIKARAERKKVRANPTVKHMAHALKSIDGALNSTEDVALRGALDEARSTVASCLGLCGVNVGARGARSRRGRGAGSKAS